MPEYRKANFLGADRPLPRWAYTGETDMRCVSQAIHSAVDHAYNHHIQRLMVLGNYFLLGGYEPQAVLRWYTEMYLDAYDWVMVPNVLGMILFADGGFSPPSPMPQVRPIRIKWEIIVPPANSTPNSERARRPAPSTRSTGTSLGNTQSFLAKTPASV
jgi:hypothetical protein